MTGTTVVPDAILPGTILIGKDTPLPESFHVLPGILPHGWTPVTCQLAVPTRDSVLAAGGWTFFFLANVARAAAFGFDPGKRLTIALGRLIGKVQRQGYNCLEIDSVTLSSFLGLPRLSISAHPRHLQRGKVLGRPLERLVSG